MKILNNNYNVANKLKKVSAFSVALFCTFYIAYFLGMIGYLYPYFDSDLIGAFIVFLAGYYVFGFLITVVVTDSASFSFRFINTAMFLGICLFFIYLIP